MTLNYIILLTLVLVLVLILAYYIFDTSQIAIPQEYADNYDIDMLVEGCRLSISSVLKENLRDMNLSKVELTKKEHLRSELKTALKESAYGSKKHKAFIKSYIKDIIQGYYNINLTNIDKVIPFNSPLGLTNQDKFEILLHVYNVIKEHGSHGFSTMVKEYNVLAKAKINDTEGLCFTEELLEEIFKTVMKTTSLSYEDKLEIVAQRIFQNFKGFGVIDLIRDASIDGVSGGVSGIPEGYNEVSLTNNTNYSFSYDAVWVMISGNTMRLKFLSFGSESELIRVAKNIYRFNNPGTLSESVGHIVTQMKDGSRVTVTRPPECASWCFWVRKFDSAPSVKMEKLLTDENAILPITLIKWIMKGLCNTIISGAQGCGKTTILRSAFRYSDPSLTLRVVELAPELHLQNSYPGRNIASFIADSPEKMQEILDFIKKTDGSITVLGEIATHEATSWFVQNAQVGSLQSVGTYHSDTVEDLIKSMRNALLATGAFSNESIAEEQVASVVRFDIHRVNVKGHRYIQRITEIIPVMDRRYPGDIDSSITDLTHKTLINQNEYYKRMTDRQLYEARDIIVFDERLNRYVFNAVPTDRTIAEIKSHLTWDEEVLFDKDLEMMKTYSLDKDCEVS